MAEGAGVTDDRLGDAFAVFTDDALDWTQHTAGAAVDVDALLAELGPEFDEPDDSPWGSTNMAWFDSEGRLRQPPQAT